MSRKKADVQKPEAVESAVPSVDEMKDLNAELKKQKPTEPGVTGYLRARIKAGK